MGFGLTEIKSLVDGVPSKPSIPSLPGITEFDNFAIGTACIEKSAEHTYKSLELRSKFISAEALMDLTKVLLGPILGVESDFSFDLPKPLDLNMDLSVSKITAPKLGDIPKCLASSLTGTTLTRGLGSMGDILSPVNSAIGTFNEMTSSASGVLNERRNSFLGNINNGIFEVEKYLEKLMGSLCAPEDKPLFVLFDNFNDFMKKTDFVNVYKDWKDIDNCMKTNCKPMAGILMTDDILWYDNEHRKFILPIELNTGKMRVYKHFENLTPQQKKKANDIEKRYYEYLSRKREAVRLGEQIARKNKVKDSENPFGAVGSAMDTTRDSIVNTLF